MRITKIFITIILIIYSLHANNLKRTSMLISNWRFEIGDNIEWSNPRYNDSNWEKIEVPGSWEQNGFPGYDGYAWYRVKFKIKEPKEDVIYYLKLGVIDDCDITYLNGNLIGFKGGFPPDYSTAHDALRQYVLPKQYLNLNGSNVISIRVYDHGGEGGIKWGDVGLYYQEPLITPVKELSGFWKFRKGDNLEYLNEDYDDSNWNNIYVPGHWQTQGYPEIGFGWYRKKFEINHDLKDENLILLLGKIDDIDETYLNGELLGKTGLIPENTNDIPIGNWEYRTIRAYYIPKHIINYKSKNTIAVRVYDGMNFGGIFEGPIGIITRSQYLKYKDNQKIDNTKGFKEFLENIFNN